MSGMASGDHNQSLMSADQSISEDNRRVLDWIAQLMKPSTRETALLELSKKREQVPELALILWHSFGTVPSLNHEFVCLSSPTNA
jgi:CCR4-NOT transcription complex subunit 9